MGSKTATMAQTNHLNVVCIVVVVVVSSSSSSSSSRGVYTRGEWCEMHHGENWGEML